MKIKVRVLSLLLCIIMVLGLFPVQVFATTVVASGYCGGEGDGTNLTWTLDSDGVLTISGSGIMADYYYDTPSPWYSYKASMTKLVLESGISTVGASAFYNSKFTGNLTIPDSVTSIGAYAFCGCSGFTGNLYIPDSVTNIGYCAFSSCSGFTGSLIIPDSVISIGDRAFSQCSGFTGSLTIGNRVTSIGRSAFERCNFTGSLIIPDSATAIGDGAFCRCSGFDGTLRIGENVTSIGGWAFEYCDGFTGALTIPDKVTFIENRAFAGCSGFNGAITLGSSIQTIGEDAFSFCYNLSGSLSIPKSVSSIGAGAFEYLMDIEEILVETGNLQYVSIGGVLYNKTVTKLVQCPAGKKEIFSIPNSVTEIGGSAFVGCYSSVLEKFHPTLELPSGVTIVGDGAFEFSGFGGTLTIPDAVTSIGDYAFEYCTDFDGPIFVGRNVASIGESAFYSSSVTEAFFLGNAPVVSASGSYRDSFDNDVTLYYISGKTGWTDSEAYDAETGTWNGYKLKAWEGYECICPLIGRVGKNQYGILVHDSSGKPVAGAQVNYDTQSGKTGEDGYVLFNKLTVGEPEITVTCDGYQPYSNKNTNYQKSENGYDIVVLYTPEESVYKLSSAWYQNTTLGTPNGPKTNVLAGTKRLSLGHTVSGEFQLCCTAQTTQDVQSYALYQGDKRIAESSDGIFKALSINSFSEGGDVFVRVTPTSGNPVDTSINLSFVENKAVDQSAIKFGLDKLSFKVDSDFPFVGGLSLNISMPQMLPDFYVSDDTIHVGVNIDLTPDDKNKFQDKLEKVRSLFKRYQYMMNQKNAGYKIGNTLQADLNYLMQNKNLHADVGPFKSSFSVIGYGEGKINENGLANVTLNLCLVYKGSKNIQGPTVILLGVPCTYSVKCGVEAALGAEVDYDIRNQTLNGDVTLEVEPELEAFGGIGIGSVIGVGAYGGATLPIEIQVIGTSQSPGVNSVDLTGELGLKAYLGPFEAEKAFLYQTWHLYTRTKSARTAASSAKAMAADILNQDSYSHADLGYLEQESTWLGGGQKQPLRAGTYSMNAVAANETNTLTALQTNTYRNMQPVIGDANGTPVMVWVCANTERGTYDYPQLVYSVCRDGSWSEPMPVDPENETTDGAPSLSTAPDGTLWLAWQSAASQTNESDTLSDFAAKQTVVVARFDADAGTFVDAQTVSMPGVFSKNPRICAEGGDVTVAWISNSDSSDYFGKNQTNAVCYASYSSSWEVQKAADNLPAVTDLAIGMYQGNLSAAFVTDQDLNLATADDRQLCLLDGFAAQRTVASGTVSAPVFAVMPDSTEQTLLYSDAMTLQSYDGTSKMILENSSLGTGFAVLSDRVLYSAADQESGSSNLYCLKYDASQGWFNAVQVTDQTQYLQSYSIAEIGGVLYLVAVQADVTITDEHVEDVCTLSWAMIDAVTDAEICSVSVDHSQEVPGESVPVSVEVKNCGNSQIDSFTITVSNGSSVVSSQTYSQMLAVSQQIEVTIDVPLGTTVTTTDYTVTVEVAGDWRTENNSCGLTLGYCDLALSVQLVQLGDSRTMLVKVTNQGAVTSGGYLTIDYAGGNKKTADIAALAYGESTLFQFEVTREDFDNALCGMVQVRLESMIEDCDSFNDMAEQFVELAYHEGISIVSTSAEQVKVHLQNRSAGILYVAVYNADGKMVKVVSQSVEADAGDCILSLQLSALPEACRIKAFLLDAESHMPILQPAVLSM